MLESSLVTSSLSMTSFLTTDLSSANFFTLELVNANLLSAFVLGLMGSSHCVAMCGGIISSLSMASGNTSSRWQKVLAYQLGRISSYTLFGFVFGFIGLFAARQTTLPLLALISGILLILMGLYISKIWLAISYLERLGKLIWNKVSPLSKRLLPVEKSTQAFSLGVLWGWLPCGLVYTSLSYATAQAQPINSALYMLFFGLGTLPATLLTGLASHGLKSGLNTRWIQVVFGLLFIVFGLYVLYSNLSVSMNGHHH